MAEKNQESRGNFPTEAVVGVVDDPGELSRLQEDLRGAGHESEVLCGARGLNRIEHSGGSTRNVHLTRTVQELFGYEVEDTERHTKALDNGNFVVLVGSDNDDTTESLRGIFKDHNAHFVNYYSRWTRRVLIP